MRDEVKLCDGVVTLAPLEHADTDPSSRPREPHSGDPYPPPQLPPHLHPHDLPERWRVHGPARTFAIRAGQPVGAVAVRPPVTGFADGDVDLLYALHPASRGRGLATRAVLLACAYARTEGARRAMILTPADRPAAAAVARRAGFARRGQISHADGMLFDWHVRALVRP